MSATSPDVRAMYRALVVKGLRAIADLIERDDAVPLPGITGTYPFGLHMYAKEPAEVRAVLPALTEATEGIDGKQYRIAGRVHGVGLSVSIDASKVGRSVTREVEQFEVEPFLPVSS